MPGAPTQLTRGAAAHLTTVSAAAWGSGSCTWPKYSCTDRLFRYTEFKTNPGHARRSQSVPIHKPLSSISEHQAAQTEFKL